MQHIPAYFEIGDVGHVVALAQCACTFDPRGKPTPAIAGLYLGQWSLPTRFALITFDPLIGMRDVQYGPSHDESVSAVLLDFWAIHGLPPHAWELVPREDVEKAAPVSTDLRAYREARASLCRALAPLRHHAYASQFFALQFHSPPPGGFVPPDPNSPTPTDVEIQATAAASET